MRNRIAKYNYGDKFKSGKKNIFIEGVTVNKKGEIIYIMSNGKEITEIELSKLTIVKP